MSEWVEKDTKAPQFKLADADGNMVSLKELRGHPVVLYFYPKDDTPGCTKEACEFRDLQPAFTRHQAAVLGVSPDATESHGAFRAKYGLNFPLLADPKHEVAEAYGAWGEKNMYGKKSMGIRRSTFLIDAEGVVRQVWKKVTVEGHADAVLQALQDLGEANATKPGVTGAR